MITHTIWTTQEDTVFISDRDRNGGQCSVFRSDVSRDSLIVSESQKECSFCCSTRIRVLVIHKLLPTESLSKAGRESNAKRSKAHALLTVTEHAHWQLISGGKKRPHPLVLPLLRVVSCEKKSSKAREDEPLPPLEKVLRISSVFGND